MPNSFSPSDGQFALLTSSLILLPTPPAAHVRPYRTLFRQLHAFPDFCAVAFGEDFEPIIWDDEEVKRFLLGHDAAQRWGVSGMGDFAVGVVRDPTWFEKYARDSMRLPAEATRIAAGEDFEALKPKLDGEEVRWVGYTCVRDATTSGGGTTDLYKKRPSGRRLPPPEQMVEVRYGMDPDFRGRGIATRAARIAMAWAVEKRGVTRFVAETQRQNDKSQGLLIRMGFLESEEDLGFREDGDDTVVEWVKVVA